MSQVRKSPLAIASSDGKPVVTTARWPVKIRDSSWGDVPNAMFIVSHQRSEKKGTDVNVASRLLLDVLDKQVEAAIVISNDSDLRLPIQESRLRVPVGTVNPGQGRLAGDLAGRRDDGVGMHWWYKLDSDDYTGCQLPDPVKQFTKPADWQKKTRPLKGRVSMNRTVAVSASPRNDPISPWRISRSRHPR